MQLKLTPGKSVYDRYRDLNYDLWYAIAEFVDNSVQSYIDNVDELKNSKLKVEITLDKDQLTIVDNAFGMDKDDLKDLVVVGRDKKETKSKKYLSEFGMGLKTGGFWFGRKIEISTKKYNVKETFNLTLDLDNIDDPDNLKSNSQHELDTSFTKITITKLNKSFSAYAKGKTKKYIGAIYSKYINSGQIEVIFNNNTILTDKIEIRENAEGGYYRWDYENEINGKTIKGYVALAKKGSRQKGGFSVSRNDRMIYCFPDKYKPIGIFGQDMGSNDMINQRHFGEFEFDKKFRVSQTKDKIIWEGEDEDIWLKSIEKHCQEPKNLAQSLQYRIKGEPIKTNPFIEDTIGDVLGGSAIDTISEDVEIIDDNEENESAAELVTEVVSREKPTYIWKIGMSNHEVHVYFSDVSESVPYLHFSGDNSKDESVIRIIININHPNYIRVDGNTTNMTNFILNCVYDALTEKWLEIKNKSIKIDPTTFRKIKDQLLRLEASKIS